VPLVGLAVGAVLVTAAALMLALSTGVIGTGHERRSTARAAEPATSVREFNLDLRPGYSHDLDVASGELTEVAIGAQPGTPDYARPDLYRTKTGRDQISGWDVTADGSGYNPMTEVPDDAGAAACRGLPARGGGNLELASAHVGSRVCLRTHGGRPVLLTILRLPTDRRDRLTVHVAVGGS
jgi:hypothetical protein